MHAVKYLIKLQLYFSGKINTFHDDFAYFPKAPKCEKYITQLATTFCNLFNTLDTVHIYYSLLKGFYFLQLPDVFTVITSTKNARQKRLIDKSLDC